MPGGWPLSHLAIGPMGRWQFFGGRVKLATRRILFAAARSGNPVAPKAVSGGGLTAIASPVGPRSSAEAAAGTPAEKLPFPGTTINPEAGDWTVGVSFVP